MVKEHNGSFVIAVTLRDEENQFRGPSGRGMVRGALLRNVTDAKRYLQVVPTKNDVTDNWSGLLSS